MTAPDLEQTHAERYGVPVPDALTHDEAEMWVEGYEAGRAEGDRQGAARALREAADAWQQGQWADAPRRADRIQERRGERMTETTPTLLAARDALDEREHRVIPPERPGS